MHMYRNQNNSEAYHDRFIAEQFQDVSQVTSFLQQLYHIKMNYSIVLNIIYKRN
jgi:hypothetical protein